MAQLLRCPCCHLQQNSNSLYCAACLQEGIALHNEALKAIQAQIDAIVARSAHLINGSGSSIDHNGNNAWRMLRADVAERDRRCKKLKQTIKQKEGDIASIQQRISRSDVAQRRSNLSNLRFTTPSPRISIQNAIKRCHFEQRSIAHHICNARRVLVQEAVNVFGLRKQPMGEWTIAALPLPSPDTLRLHPSTHINAALLHTIHLLALITSYLSITLPFAPTPPPPFNSRHIGRPLIKANTPFVSTTKWRDQNILWMSSTASVTTKVKPRKSAIIDKSMTKHRQFLTSFALLSFSIAYLAWSQGVEGIGIIEDYHDNTDDDDHPSSLLISATSILELIAELAKSPKLGQKSHEPGSKEVARHLGFGLDVAKVVQSVLNAEENRWGTKPSGGSGEELSEGWDLLDNEGS